MSLFQCGHCGCCENTALACQGCDGYAEDFFDWAGFEDRKGKKLCSACAPTRYKQGEPSGFGVWHGRFPRTFLPMGAFRTARNGNLEHIETGDQDFRKFAIAISQRGSEAQRCQCGSKLASECSEPWEPGCDLGANPAHVKVAPKSEGAAVDAALGIVRRRSEAQG